MTSTRLVVAVLTFQRPAQLRIGLPLILEQVRALNVDPAVDVDARVLVVDNDPAGTGAAAVDELADPLVRYVLEPEPGISAGRNRSLDEATDQDLLVFLDDDERPRPDWLTTIVRTWFDSRTAAVMGRVVSNWQTPPPDWVVAGEFFRRPRMPTGTEIPVAAAGNLLLDLTQVRALGVRFSNELGLSGGEDNLFSQQLVAAGGRIVWCDESVADETVADQRLTYRWLSRRSWSHGNTASFVALELVDGQVQRGIVRLSWTAQGLIRLVVGSVRLAAGKVTGSATHYGHGIRLAYRGAGMISGAMGHTYQEYARPVNTAKTSS